MKSLKNIFIAIRILLLCLLFMISFFFVKSVFEDFASKASSMKRSMKKFDKLKFPTILYCFDPAMKNSTMEKYHKYGVNDHYLNNFINVDFENNLIGEVLEESGYNIDEDFELFMYNVTSK